MTLVDARGNIIIGAETKAAERALSETAKKTAALNKELKKAETRSRALNKASLMMSKGLFIAAAAGAALLANSVRLAARTETLGVVVNKLGENAGYTNAQMDKLTQGVVDQGITLRHSRTAIAMMAQANIDLAKSSDLARLAQDAAVIANLNSSETFQRLIQVIQTGNIRMARHLGLVVDFQRAYMDFAKANGITTDALDQTQKAQIRVTEVMRAGQAIAGTYEAAMETAGKKVLSLERHLEESSRILGELFLPAFADAVDTVTKFLESIQAMDEGQRASMSTTIALATGFAALGGVIFKLRPAFTALKIWLAEATIASALASGGITLLLGGIAALITMLAADEAQYKANTTAISDMTEAWIEEGKRLEEINRLIEQEGEARGMQEAAITQTTVSMYGQATVVNILSRGYELLTEESLASYLAQLNIAKGAETADTAMLGLVGRLMETETGLGNIIPQMAGFGTALSNYTRAAVASKVAQGILNDAIEAGRGITDEERSSLEKLYMAMGEPPTEVGALVDIFNELAGGVEPIDVALQEVYTTIEEMATPVDSLSIGLIKAQEDAGLVAVAASDDSTWGAAVEWADKFGGSVWDAYRNVLKLRSALNSLPGVDGGGGGGGGGGNQALNEAKFGTHMGGGLSGIDLIGDQGQELVINGVVIPNALTNRLLNLGLSPTKKYGLGGTIEAGYVAPTGGGGGITYDPETYPNDIRGIKPSERAAYTAAQTAATPTATAAIKTAIANVVEPALAAMAIAMPSSQEIAAGIQQAQLAQVQEQMRQTAEMLAELKIQTQILAEQGTADDTGRAVRDGVQGIV